MRRLLHFLLILGVIGLAGLILAVSIWHERLPESSNQFVSEPEMAASVLLGEQSLQVEAWPGTWRYTMQRIRDRWRLTVTQDTEARVQLLFDYAEGRVRLTQTLAVHGRATEAVEALQRGAGYWLWAMMEMKQLPIERQQVYQSQSERLAMELEKQLGWLHEAGPAEKKDEVRHLLDQVLSEKLYWQN